MSADSPLAMLPAPLFDLEVTLASGQVFHWRRQGAGYLGVIGEQPVYVEQRGAELHVTRGSEELVRRYFALDHPLAEIYASFPGDAELQTAVAACGGLRIIRQPLWECLATFITSSMKQVAHIAAMSHALRERFGEPILWEGKTLYAYPTLERLAATGEAPLRACGLGYRAANLWKSAGLIARGEVDLPSLRQRSDAEALQELLRLPGVGIKVAHCALLFAFERLAAFPIDVWIERVLRSLYFPHRRQITTAQLQEFSALHFGPYGGYAQQYLFHYARKIMPRPPRVTTRRVIRKKPVLST